MMTSQLELGVGLAKLKITLSEFAGVMKSLVGEAQHQEVRQAIKDLIAAARTSYDTTVDVLTPLYALDTEDRFNSDFGGVLASFKNQYLKDFGLLVTHCSEVDAKLGDLKSKKRFMRNIPLVNRSFARMDRLAEAWLAQDYELARDMELFLRRMNDFLDGVSQAMASDPSEAYEDLKWSLTTFEDDFLGTKRGLNELTVISSRL